MSFWTLGTLYIAGCASSRRSNAERTDGRNPILRTLSGYAKPLALPGLIIVGLGFVYLKTLLPGVGFNGDTAKFQFVGKVLGTPHTTGYPTYVLLNHVFVSLLPFGDTAYRANLLSAVFTITACVVLFRTLSLLRASPYVAFIASLSFGLTFTIWSQSIVAEVYALNALYVSLVTHFLVRWSIHRIDRDLILAGACYALSLAHHLTMLTLLPAILYLIFITDRRAMIRRKNAAWIGLFIAISALQYLYIYWRTIDPKTPYLEMQAPNLKVFWWYITGGQFKGAMFSSPIQEVLFKRIPIFVSRFTRDWLLLAPIAVVGLIYLPQKAVRNFLLLSFCGSVLFAVNYAVPGADVYFIPAFLIAAVFVGTGLEAIWKTFAPKAPMTAALALMCFPALLLFFNYGKVDQSRNTAAAQEVQSILRTVESDALIVSPGYDYSEYFWYHLLGEEVEARDNIYVLHHFAPDLVQEFVREDKPLYLPEERRYVPIGLTVYCMSEEHQSALNAIGLTTISIGNGLYRVQDPLANGSLSR